MYYSLSTVFQESILKKGETHHWKFLRYAEKILQSLTNKKANLPQENPLHREENVISLCYPTGSHCSRNFSNLVPVDEFTFNEL